MIGRCRDPKGIKIIPLPVTDGRNLQCQLRLGVSNSDCNPGIEFSIPGSGIEKFVIPGSRNPVSGLGSQIGRHFNIFY